MTNKETIIPLKKELLSPAASHLIFKIILNTTEFLNGLEISDSTKENLEEINQTLTETSIIGVGYHPSKIEGGTVPIALRASLSNMKHLIGPIAAYQYHKPKVKVWVDFAASLLNTQFLPTVRPDNKDDEKYKEFTQTYKASLHYHTKDKLSHPGAIYGIVPEATRSKELLGPEHLNTSFIKHSINPHGRMPYIPIAAFFYDKRYHFRVGKLIHLSDAPKTQGSEAEIETHHSIWVMQHLAGILPKGLRGPYDPIFS